MRHFKVCLTVLALAAALAAAGCVSGGGPGANANGNAAAGGGTGAGARRTFDIEAWLPGQERYRELTSCSNTTDFQARRLKIRSRRDGGKPEDLHTLNGTAVAVGRTIIALLETGQRDDGTIALPACLGPWGAPAELAAASAP